MKVVIPTMSLETSGGCKSLVEIGNALHAKGHDAEILVPQSMTVAYDVICKLTRVPEISKENIPYGDIVLTNFYHTFRPAYEAWPKQCVRFCQGYEPSWLEGKDREHAIWTYSQGVPVIAASHWVDEQLYILTGKRSEAITGLALDTAVFQPDTLKWPKQRHKIILYIARHPGLGFRLKGYHDFVESLRLFKQMYQGEFQVYMVCVEGILPLPDVPVRIFGTLTDRELASLYQIADVFVSTSWTEGFGLPPLEALACGTPVVTTNSGGVMDYCRHLKTAYVVEPKNPKGIAEGMYEVLTNEKLARNMVKNARKPIQEFAKERFEQKVVSALEQIYQKRKG